jgi:hypothetical protein
VTSNTLALLQYNFRLHRGTKGRHDQPRELVHNRLILAAFAFNTEGVTVTATGLSRYGLTNGLSNRCTTDVHVTGCRRILSWPMRWLQAISRCKATAAWHTIFAHGIVHRELHPEQRETST